jgi:hypothetical protein
MEKNKKIMIAVILGVIVIGGVWYYYNYVRPNKKLTASQKENRNIEIINTDL